MPRAHLHAHSQPATPHGAGLARAAWAQIRVGMAILDLDGRIVEVNPAYCAMTGFGRAELVGRLAGDLRGTLARLLDGDLDHFTFESHLRHADGSEVWINATVSLAHTDDGARFFIVSATEIGELVQQRVEVERALAQSDLRYRALAVNSSDLVTIVDIETSAFTYVSPSIRHLLGYDPEQLVGTNGFDLFHPDDVVRVAQAATEALTSGTVGGPLTYRARHRDGSWRWHESVLTDLTDDPSIAGIVTNTRDVTDRVEAENQMAALTARFQGILDNASDAILSLDRDQRIIMFNKAAEATFGYRADEVIGGPLHVLLPERFRPAHDVLVDRFQHEDSGARRMNQDRPELTGRRRDGTEFPAEITISRLEVDGQVLLTAIVPRRDRASRGRGGPPAQPAGARQRAPGRHRDVDHRDDALRRDHALQPGRRTDARLPGGRDARPLPDRAARPGGDRRPGPRARDRARLRGDRQVRRARRGRDV